MRILLSVLLFLFSALMVNAQFKIEKELKCTPVKNQAMTGTCWCFSTTSLVESESMRKGFGEFDLSEMFIVRNIYVEKARNYILRQGAAQFGQGGLGHDLIRAIATYGVMPESVFGGNKTDGGFNHMALEKELKAYLDDALKQRPVSKIWELGFIRKLDSAIGVPPANFQYNNKNYTPQSFAKEVLKFDANDYINITSFEHHPFFQPFILEAPDNFSNGSYYNLPLNDMIELVKASVRKGLSVMWDADCSNKLFRQSSGLALQLQNEELVNVDADDVEIAVTQSSRQFLYENLTTQDDHLMHVVGLAKSARGKSLFMVKNSWGSVGPYQGKIYVSDSYFAVNTVSLIVPKAALSRALLEKLKIK
jgi:bleomycin hydrolase